MITRASFRNFKSLREVDITFDSRLTVLVGPNGSGKSSILQGLNLLCQAAYDNSKIDPTLRTLPSSLATGTRQGGMSLEISSGPLDGVGIGLQLSVANPVGNGRPYDPTPGWRYFADVDGERKEWVGEAPPSDRWARLVEASGPAILLRMDAGRLAEPAGPKSIPPTVLPDGSGLAPALDGLKSDQKPEFDRIVEEFRAIIPDVVDVRFETVSVDPDPYRRGILLDFRGATGIRAADASTGTLHALGLLAVILGPNKPRVVLLDDIDQGLHPKAQMNLIGVLRRILDRHPELQVVAASHSPYILDQLGWDEVRVTTICDDGAAICKPLTDHPDVKRWRDAMSPGEFWSHTGEDWVRKLRDKEVAAAAP